MRKLLQLVCVVLLVPQHLEALPKAPLPRSGALHRLTALPVPVNSLNSARNLRALSADPWQPTEQLVSSAEPPAGQRGDRKESPFDGLRWSTGQPEVKVEGTWYTPVSIHGTDVQEILNYCGKRWPGKLEKRFAEDLIEAMEGMGVAPPAKVNLVLLRLEDGEQVTLTGVTLSESKRNALRDANREAPPSRPRGPATLTHDQALADIAEFQARLEDQFAYLHMKGLNLYAMLEELAGGIGEEVESVVLADDLQCILMRFGDGHSNVSSPHAKRPDRYPPVLLAAAQGSVVAFAPDRSAFLDPRRPFVVSIDGHSIEEWVEFLQPWIVDGSEQVVRKRVLGGLRELALWRERLGHPASGTVAYELASKPSARSGKVLEIQLGSRRPVYGLWPKGKSHMLKGNLGYLRLEQMDDEMIPELRRAMGEFKDTKGLVVDVRGNGGGRRGLLLALAGYLVGPDEGPWVGNVAAYRSSSRFRASHLEARFMKRAGAAAWSAQQRAAIAAFARTFQPEWEPGAGFSGWHYLVLDRTGHADEYFYDRPVVVLSDSGCFSATDIFLGALSGHPRVTLMGMASGGGSARTQAFTLANSQIEVRCASMASFRSDGRLYDGRGVEVDREVPALAVDLLGRGEDSVLNSAIRLLNGR